MCIFRAMKKEKLNRIIRKNTMFGVESLEFIRNKFIYVLKRKISGDVVECGVWRGGCSAMLANTAIRFKSLKTFHLFDIFDDICEPTLIDGPKLINEIGGQKHAMGRLLPIKGVYDRLGGPGKVENVYKLLTSMVGYPKEKINIYKGWFQHTVVPDSKNIKKISFLMLDGDLYASIKVCLENLYDKVVPGGIVFIDDYFRYDGCKLAVDEFIKNRKLKVKFLQSDRACWKK